MRVGHCQALNAKSSCRKVRGFFAYGDVSIAIVQAMDLGDETEQLGRRPDVVLSQTRLRIVLVGA